MAGGGLVQLVAYGAQDVYLTGSAQITYFKVVYRRHTNFSVETIEQSFDGKAGGKSTVLVTRNGDLATNACLKVKLNAVDATDNLSNVEKVAWVKRLGHALVSQVKIEIGGSTIDSHVGTWLDLWYELTHKYDQERGYKAAIGDVEELTKLRDASEGLPAYTLYVPFQFWFCRNTGLALPLIALQYHEVRFHLEFEAITKLLVWSGDSGTGTPSMGAYTFNSTSIMIDYVYLDSDERRKFAQVGHEYLMEEVQYSGGETLAGTVTLGSSITNKFKLNFNHPCKELVWALKAGAFSGEGLTGSFGTGNTFLAYTHGETAADWSTAVDNAVKGLCEQMIHLSTDSSYDTSLHENTVADLDTGASAVDTMVTERLGKLNVTMVETAEGGVVAGDVAALNAATSVLSMAAGTHGAVDFGAKIVDADVTVTFNGSDTSALSVVRIECTRVEHTVTLADLSIPLVGTLSDNRNRTHVAKCANANYDLNVIQHHNYGLDLSGKGNVIGTGKIELNGHARFEAQEGSYFNYLQTKAHTRTPADGVNVYCFGLHPENHQPSGTANLSRIDTTLLILTLTDPLRKSGGSNAFLDWTSDSRLHIFAVNYNILRVMSGMAGKAYSN